ncbi:hypothetical protein JKP88DRAFT_253239 [Tribonema minus]|uniref:Uncharacterized protein n=1 Tax=Tribonema minus TaxID=303371 RepID=A0A835Z897_9STRA|nr:hypothetical protein JKP88DRAFT_253239 [Tribonema minus]
MPRLVDLLGQEHARVHPPPAAPLNPAEAAELFHPVDQGVELPFFFTWEQCVRGAKTRILEDGTSATYKDHEAALAGLEGDGARRAAAKKTDDSVLSAKKPKTWNPKMLEKANKRVPLTREAKARSEFNYDHAKTLARLAGRKKLQGD